MWSSFIPKLLVTSTLLAVDLQISYQVEAKCWEVSRKARQMVGFCSERNGKEALQSLRSADSSVGSSVLEEAQSSKITRISFLFQFLQHGAERKEFLPRTTALMRHLGKGRTCSGGPAP